MVRVSVGDQKGVVLTPRCPGQQKVLDVKRKNHGNMTLVAIVSDNPRIQPCLPQVIIGNERTLRAQDLQRVKDSLPGNVYVIRRKTGWVDAPMFAQILGWLRQAVSAVDRDMEILLLADVSPVHTHALVFKTAKRHRIRLCFVPASCTWLLQPCDTHGFRKFKAAVARQCRAFLVQNSCSQVPMTEFLAILTNVIRTVIQGTMWQKVFDHNGYGKEQKEVSERVLCNLAPDVCNRVKREFPSAENLNQMLPKKRAVNHEMLRIFTLEPMPVPVVSSAATCQAKAPRLSRSASNSLCDSGGVDSQCLAEESMEESDSAWAQRLRPRARARASTISAVSSN